MPEEECASQSPKRIGCAKEFQDQDASSGIPSPAYSASVPNIAAASVPWGTLHQQVCGGDDVRPGATSRLTHRGHQNRTFPVLANQGVYHKPCYATSPN